MKYSLLSPLLASLLLLTGAAQAGGRGINYTNWTIIRQRWESGIRQAIEKAANSRRDEIDRVLSNSRTAVSTNLSPDALTLVWRDEEGISLDFSRTEGENV